MARKSNKKGGLGETLRTVVYAVVIAVVIRTFAYEPFNIPSESMLPTLLVGDYLFVSKFSYGYSRHSLPFGLPLFSGLILAREPHRGDVAVFKLPSNDSTDYIKRIIGLPGDRVQMKDGLLHVNGEAVRRERIEDFRYRNSFGREYLVPQYLESLQNGMSYRTLDLEPQGTYDNTAVFVVPAGHYFAMGDNRDNSLDSRAPPSRLGVGLVPAENLVGRAETLFFSTDGSAAWWEVWRWPFATRFGRIFQGVSG